LSRFPSIEPVEQLLDVTAVEVVGEFRLRLTLQAFFVRAVSVCVCAAGD
jgi:hypothetical protein